MGMVFFKIVESRSFWYFFFRKWLTFIFRYSYYRRFYVRNLENVPRAGTPFIMVSNHQNGLIDALGILFALPLRYKVVFLARADVFKKKTAAKILNFCKIMPIYRQRDGRDNLGENQEIFDESARLLEMGFPVTLFPEGQHQEGHYLGLVKKGFARIAFDAAEKNGFPSEMMILPVGNHYSDYFASRADMCITFGEPIPLSDFYPLYRENQAKAMTLLAERVRPAIQKLMLDIPDREHYPLYDSLREVVRNAICARHGLRRRYFPDCLQADRLFADRIRQSTEEELSEIRRTASSYLSDLRKSGLSNRGVEKPLGFGGFLLYIFLLLAGFPIALYGLCFTGIPVTLGRRKSKQISIRIRNRMLRGSFDFVLTQIVMQAIFYLLYIILYWIFFKSWLCFVLLLFSWVFTRMFWQDYLHFARKALLRMKASFKPELCKGLRLRLEKLQAWAVADVAS